MRSGGTYDSQRLIALGHGEGKLFFVSGYYPEDTTPQFGRFTFADGVGSNRVVVDDFLTLGVTPVVRTTFGGFELLAGEQRFNLRPWAVFLPDGPVIFILCVGPLIWAVRGSSRLSRVASPLCHACGYDLRASPDRCPECGAIRPIPARA